jgi:YVTN family beta-propeller protein
MSMSALPRNITSFVFPFLACLGPAWSQPYAYVSSVAGNNVVVVNTATASVMTSVRVPTSPTGLAVTPDGTSVYVAAQGAGSVAVLNATNNTLVKTIGVGSGPVAVGISPNGAMAYAVNQASNTVSAIDTASQAVVATIPVGTNPMNVTFSLDSSRAYVTNLLSGNVTVIDTNSRTVVTTFAALTGPNGIAVTPNGRYLYVANQYSNAVTVHDISSGNILATISGLNAPNCLAITPNGSRVFVVNGNGSSASAIDTTSNSVIATIPTGPIPTSVAISPDGTRAYVTNEYGFSLSVIDTASNTSVNTVQGVAVYPIGVAMAPPPTQPPPPPAATLNGVSVNPTAVTSGQSATGTVTLTAAAGAGGASVSLSSSYPAGANVPASTMVPQGAISATFTITSGTVSSATAVTVTASYLGVSKSASLIVNPAPVSSATASFVTADTTTQGNWKSKYGADGYTVVDDSIKNPSYGTVSASSQSDYIWASSTTDVRALQKAAANDRLAATWYSPSSFYVDVNFTDQSPHQVAAYCLDWDGLGRAQTIDVLDATTNAVLDSRSISGFNGGTYLVWNITGHVKLHVTVTAGANAVVEGIFFGAGSTSSGANSATFVGTDTATQGNWKSKYGRDGYTVVDDSAKNPSYATIAPSGAADYIWNFSTTDARALQKGSASDRIASTWYSPSSFSVDVNMTDQSVHQVAIYCVDWDGGGRSQTVDVLDATTNAVLSTRSLSSFGSGVYLVWNVTGHVKLRFTQNAGYNAVVSGVFFGGPNGPSATFVTTDTTTQGSWKSKYGLDGYSIADDSTKSPSYATMTPSAALDWVWSSSTSDVRAVQKGLASDRIASTWYSPSVFYMDVNITDQSSHQIEVYCLDWDSGGRSQTVDVLDANTNAVLDSRSVSSFSGGVYLIWNVSGHVKLRVTYGTGYNAVVNGIFFR